VHVLTFEFGASPLVYRGSVASYLPTSQGEASTSCHFHARFRATMYPCPDTIQERREMAVGVMTRIEDLQTVRKLVYIRAVRLTQRFGRYTVLFWQPKVGTEHAQKNL
jgi:hypothetical protein